MIDLTNLKELIENTEDKSLAIQLQTIYIDLQNQSTVDETKLTELTTLNEQLTNDKTNLEGQNKNLVNEVYEFKKELIGYNKPKDKTPKDPYNGGVKSEIPKDEDFVNIEDIEI